ncbi:MAG: PGPGW domain-containing protein [Nitrospirales bacterium]
MFVLSIVAFIGTLFAIPQILKRLPADYFDEHVHRTWMAEHHPVLRTLTLLLKNLLGIVFLLAGLAMLLLPGQGILTMIIGISLIDFPGKRKLERKLICIPGVLKVINGLRQKYDKPPLNIQC